MSQIEAAKSGQVTEGAVHVAAIEGHSIALTRIAGAVQAFENKCPHLGLKLAKGKLDGGTITCPFHGSKFDIRSGRNLNWTNAFLGIPLPGWMHGMVAMGKQPTGLKIYPAREQDGAILVDIG